MRKGEKEEKEKERKGEEAIENKKEKNKSGKNLVRAGAELKLLRRPDQRRRLRPNPLRIWVQPLLPAP